ncbi:hypothetical protein M407DRAFT_246013 [Tulasnella calospora MUT 4182]|uniref:Uncharacterized protein n=1 Tax=Tulasnella calospora MUT 4182 TaxID=1051891 RepID=A0A0C3PXS2_9AGAM|nr:hypothetical protein M407DRAFT_246013 [Tulasnella calospora MUT 4182]
MISDTAATISDAAASAMIFDLPYSGNHRTIISEHLRSRVIDIRSFHHLDLGRDDRTGSIRSADRCQL